MMRRLFLRAALLLAAGATLHGAGAAEARASLDEAQAMVRKAAAYLKKNGIDKAVAEVNQPKGQFVDRDLYVTILDGKNINLAHGANQKMVGKDLSEMRDADGTYIARQRNEVLKTKNEGSINYRFLNPVSGKIEPKTMFFTKVDGYVVSCGAYTP